MATSLPATTFDPRAVTRATTNAASSALASIFGVAPMAAPAPAQQQQPTDPNFDFNAYSQPAHESTEEKLRAASLALGPQRLTVSGGVQDPFAPTGLDWLSAHGPHAHSWYTGQSTATPYNGPTAAMAENQTSRGMEHGSSPFGTGSVSTPSPGLPSAMSYMFGEPTSRYLTEQGTANGNPAMARHVANLDDNQQDLLRADKGYNLPAGPQGSEPVRPTRQISEVTNSPNAGFSRPSSAPTQQQQSPRVPQPLKTSGQQRPPSKPSPGFQGVFPEVDNLATGIGQVPMAVGDQIMKLLFGHDIGLENNYLDKNKRQLNPQVNRFR